MASSVRLTTAPCVAWRLWNVVVSRNGLITISSSPHSTPMGAKLIAPRASIVVSTDSMITGPARPEGKRLGGRGARAPDAVRPARQILDPRRDAVQEPVDEGVAILGEHGLRVKLQPGH